MSFLGRGVISYLRLGLGFGVSLSYLKWGLEFGGRYVLF